MENTFDKTFHNKDVFYEQLYKKKKLAVDFVLQIALWIIAFALAVGSFIVLVQLPGFGSMLGFLAVIGFAYGAYRANMLFEVEYEYIYLNGEIDFDVIVSKNSRTRKITVKPVNVLQYGVYDNQIKAKLQHMDIKKTFNFDSRNGNSLYYIVTKHKEFGKTLVIFEPDERIRSDFERHIPKQW